MTYHRERDRALAVVDEIENGGGEAVATRLDLASTGSVSQAVGTAIERWGQVDVLVNNAVYWGDRVPWEAPLFEELAPEEWRAYFRVNFEGAYSAVQATLPSMRSRGFGRIVNVSSGVAADGFPGGAPYGAAKAALHGLTKTLSKELAPAGILVNVVMPSATRTERMVARLPAQVLERKELSLPAITIPRADLTSEEVTRALRAGLGPHYHVVPGMRMPQACLFAAEPNQDPDTILVSIGSSRLSNRFFRAQVTLTRPSGQTVIRIRPGGTSSEFPINALGIARKIRQVLASAPGIR